MNTAENATGMTVWSASKNAVSCEVEGEMVLLDLQSGTYFGLNSIGAEIWNQVTQRKSFAEIQKHLLSEYRVTPERCEAEVLSLLTKLAEKGLVKCGNDEPIA